MKKSKQFQAQIYLFFSSPAWMQGIKKIIYILVFLSHNVPVVCDVFCAR